MRSWLVTKEQLIYLYLVLTSPSLAQIKKKKRCKRSKVTKPLTSHCCRVSLVTFLPTLLTSLPSSHSVKSPTPCSNNPWPTGSRHNGLKITHHLPWQQLPTANPPLHTISTLQNTYNRLAQDRWVEPKISATTQQAVPTRHKVHRPTLHSKHDFFFFPFFKFTPAVQREPSMILYINIVDILVYLYIKSSVSHYSRLCCRLMMIPLHPHCTVRWMTSPQWGLKSICECLCGCMCVNVRLICYVNNPCPQMKYTPMNPRQDIYKNKDIYITIKKMV